jgi:hypothetical protein
VVDQLAIEHADQPVVFLEYDVDNPPGDRRDLWRAAYGIGSVTLPLVMVDSGHQISNGFEAFATVYRAMVESSLARPPLARLVVERERIGDTFSFEVRLTNLGEVTLSSSNHARLHAIVYEEAHIADTGRYVRAVASTAITSLAPGATATFTLEVSLPGASWNRLRSVVLADYRPAGTTGPYDMLQASHQP